MAHKIEVFTSPTCPHCPGAVKVVEEAKAKLGDEIEVQIAINNSLAFIGAPTLEELLERLE